MLPMPLPTPPQADMMSSFSDPFAAARNQIRMTKAFTKKLDELFPGALHHEEAAVSIKHVLRSHGFTTANTIALVAQCRDEITKPFINAIDHAWSGSFNIGALAGTVICGTTGFNAALHHAPQDSNGEERYVVFCGPHIAIDAEGKVGSVMRRGRKGASSACGALIAFANELASGRIDVTEKPLDVEYNHLRKKVLPHLNFGGRAPKLAELTQKAHDATVEDVRSILADIGTGQIHAIVSGVLVHGPNASHFFWPGILEVVDGAGEVTDVRQELVNATRDDYKADMLWYLTAKAQSSSFRCAECAKPVG